jgi:tetratricopeptide (TPR) repeat protein
MIARHLRAPWLIVTAAIAGALSIVAAAAPKVDADDVAVLDRWVRAVRTHVPGRLDDALARVAALTYDDRQHLNKTLDAFFSGMSHAGAGTAIDDADRAAQRGTEAARAPGANAFLERAAMLHADAVIFAARLPAPPPDSRDVDDGAHAQLVSSSDGEYEGTLRPSWHEQFARDLLDRITPKPAADPFVGRWYHAMSAYLFSGTRYGEASPLLRHAAEILPDDARILFDRACLSETLGSPQVQSVLNDPRARPLTAARDVEPGVQLTLVVPIGERQANGDAEQLFRHALDVDGSIVEARVRLGRLLLLRGHDAEAATMLARAVAAADDPAVTYLAHLLAARADTRLGNLDKADAHADAALALFPGAQSALIAKSYVALQRADAAGALDPITRLAQGGSRVPPRDPWSEYYLGAGRDLTALLSDLWSSVRR